MATASKVGPRVGSTVSRRNGTARTHTPARPGQRGSVSSEEGSPPPYRERGRVDTSRDPGRHGHAEKFGINEENLAIRREFIRLGPEEQSRLAALIPWARSAAPQIAREFYDWQFAFEPTRRFFESYAQSARMSLEELRQTLESAQTAYFL